jgi:hypothetical protein
MAFLKKKSKLPAALLRGFLIFILITVLSGGLYYLYQMRMKELKERHEEEIGQYKFQLYQLDRQALVPKQDIEYGTMLSIGLFDQVDMKMEVSQELLLDETDMGKTSLVKLPKGIPVTKSVVVSEPPANDLRRVEFNMFQLQTDQSEGEFIDIRIIFPNAENYIVLGKKQIKSMQAAENILWLWLDETEIHRISSAIIDAYLHPGTKLYAATYIQPEMQAAATPYYPANPDVLDLMRTDPNILKKASDMLAREARAILESHLQTMTLDEITKVSAGVGEEINHTHETIKNAEVNKIIQENQKPNGANPSENIEQDDPGDAYN